MVFCFLSEAAGFDLKKVEQFGTLGGQSDSTRKAFATEVKDVAEFIMRSVAPCKIHRRLMEFVVMHSKESIKYQSEILGN